MNRYSDARATLTKVVLSLHLFSIAVISLPLTNVPMGSAIAMAQTVENNLNGTSSSSSSSSESSSGASVLAGTGSSASSSSEASSESSSSSEESPIRLDLSVPNCKGFAATVYVIDGVIAGGPLSGQPYEGNLVGTSRTDVLLGTPGKDFIVGLDGDDLICGGDENDALYGGAGNDVIYGMKEHDFLRGDGGDDILYGEEGNDTMNGNDGDDTLGGGSDTDYLIGESGNDLLLGGDGKDLIVGGDGNDEANGENDTDAVYGNAGDDTLIGGTGDDFLSGGHGNDVLNEVFGNDVMTGGPGNDTLRGKLGDDQMWGNTGNDSIEGDEGDDVMRGGDGNDTINGYHGADKVCGNAGDDVITANLQDDQLDGGDGIDTMEGGFGADICSNGENLSECEDTVTLAPLCAINEFDYGDAPNFYGTAESNDGARHYHVPGIHLGELIDTEPDGAPGTFAAFDDSIGVDDDDGVDFGSGALIAGATGSLTITASVSGYVEGWIDLDQNGTFNRTDKILNKAAVPAGASVHSYFVPSTLAGPTYARFRFTTNDAGLFPDGMAINGEVEDYLLMFVASSSSASSSSSSSESSSSSSGEGSSSSSEESGSSSSSGSSESSSSSEQVLAAAITGTDSTVNNGNARHRGSQTNVLRAALAFTYNALAGRGNNATAAAIAPGGFGGGPVSTSFTQLVAPGSFGGGETYTPSFNELERSMICRTKVMTAEERMRENALMTTWAASQLSLLLNRDPRDVQWGLHRLPCGERRAPDLGTAETPAITRRTY